MLNRRLDVVVVVAPPICCLVVGEVFNWLGRGVVVVLQLRQIEGAGRVQKKKKKQKKKVNFVAL